ncbi:hypothetical protein Ddye_001418 [Dipteronia dyeriana]|uniref:Myb/SANT-like domain-containing protein n=1 Tax=Dipteronia dyeriana TaxID=168575 RepID=A0AAE0CTH8_9ROSI|nr:hypothetical protein Ddye_001418 [Dipteronia dyeriana]
MANEGAQEKAKAVWDPPTHEIWVDLAIEQVRAGNRNGIHLSKQGWKYFIENFNKITGKTYDRKQLVNHWDNMKKEWQLWDSLKYPEASKFRVKGLEHVFNIDELFRDVTATGDRAWAPTSGLTPPLYSQAFMTDGNVSLDSEEAVHEDEVECSNRKPKTLAPNRKKERKKEKNNSYPRSYSSNLRIFVIVLRIRILIYELIHLVVVFKKFLIS